MDEFTKKHLDNWLDTLFQPRYHIERELLKKKIIEFVKEYPDLLLSHSWPEIRNMIEKNS